MFTQVIFIAGTRSPATAIDVKRERERASRSIILGLFVMSDFQDCFAGNRNENR